MEQLMRAALGASILAALLFALSGCAQTPHINTAPPPPQVVTVDKVVTVPCVKPSDIPPEPPRVGSQLNGDAPHDLEIIFASALGLRQWGEKQAALLAGCVG